MFQGCVGKIFQNTIFGEHSKTSRGAHLRGEHVQFEDILLMEEIPNNHLGCIKPVNNGINYLSTGAGFQPSTVFHQDLYIPDLNLLRFT